MKTIKKMVFAAILLLLVHGFAAPRAVAGGKEYKIIVKHLQTRYQAKKVKIPFVWLARFAVRAVRPAGVKSFSVTVFENLNFASGVPSAEIQSALDNSFDQNWSRIVRARSASGEQSYMYMREAGDSVKIMFVAIEKNQATVVRAAFSPEKLAGFLDDPKILGISLSDNSRRTRETAATENSDAK